MPPVPILFPASSTNPARASEGGGRLINCYAEKLGDGARNVVAWKRVPGLRLYAETGYPICRGMIEVNGSVYAVMGERVLKIDHVAGVLATVTDLGEISGTDPVTLARNNKVPSPDIVCVADIGTFIITTSAVSALSDTDLPQPNSVTFLDGFFVFSIADGRFFNSGLNATTIGANDFGKAEARADGLVRAVAYAQQLYLFGSRSTEIWSNAGNATGTPFSRSTVIPRGLLGKHAIAGFEEGWTNTLVFVSDDGVVYRMSGYEPVRVSSHDIERQIAALDDPTLLQATVFMVSGHAFWALSAPAWTWVYDLTTGEWHERESAGMDRWRAVQSVKYGTRWIVGDSETAQIYEVGESTQRENEKPLVFRATSVPSTAFPDRLRVSRADFNFTVGQGMAGGEDPVQTDPVVSISWSDDGGNTWASPLLRPLGRQGEFRKTVTVNRTGLTGAMGRQWRVEVSDPVYVSLLGGTMEVERRRR